MNVPLLGVADNAPNAVTIAGEQYPKPNVIVFRFKTGGPGHVRLALLRPVRHRSGRRRHRRTGQLRRADGDDGYMAGTLTVT